MQDNTLRVIVSEKTELAPPAPPGALTAGIVAAGASLVTLFFLFALNPFASGYGAEPVSVLHFASVLWKGEDWQHCYLVPIAVAAMVYFKRKQLFLADIQASWTGLVITLFGFAVYWLGFRADNIYLGYGSFQILTGGLLLWLCGWVWFRHLFWAWGFLVFLYPVPFLDNAVAFPLRMIMSQASVDVLNLMGIGAIKTGTAILSAPDTLAGIEAGKRFSVDVADPCSGIRSLFALMMVSALFGYFTQPGIWRKVAMFLCSLPLAVLGNLARILMLTIGTLAFGSDFAIGSEDTMSAFHSFAGFMVFGVAIMGLMGIGKLLNTDLRKVFHQTRSLVREQATLARPASNPAMRPNRVHDEY